MESSINLDPNNKNSYKNIRIIKIKWKQITKMIRFCLYFQDTIEHHLIKKEFLGFLLCNIQMFFNFTGCCIDSRWNLQVKRMHHFNVKYLLYLSFL